MISATRSIASLDDCTRCRATSMRRRSIAFDGVDPVSAMKAAGEMPRAHAGALGEILHGQFGVEVLARPGQQRARSARPVGAFNSKSEENCDCPPLRR